MVWACFKKEEESLGEKMIEYEVEGVRPRGRLGKTWGDVVEKDCQFAAPDKQATKMLWTVGNGES